MQRFGDLTLGVWYELKSVKKHGIYHVSVSACAGDPKTDYGVLDSSMFLDAPLAHRWGAQAIAGLLRLAQDTATEA